MCSSSAPQWVAADTKLKDPSVQNQELKVHPSKPGIGQNIAVFASPTAWYFFLELISTFLVHSPYYFETFSREIKIKK